MSGQQLPPPAGSPGEGVEDSITSASDLTLSDQTLSPPSEPEEVAADASRETSPDQDEPAAINSQPQDEEGKSSLTTATEEAHTQDKTSQPQEGSKEADSNGVGEERQVEDGGGEGNTSGEETTPHPSPSDQGAQSQDNKAEQDDEWQDILGSGQLMKKV